jgi:drug/metabolite transporter superfamily protein YnfA
MNNLTAYAILLVAAALEAGGDALVRLGIHRDATMSRIAFLGAGAIVLFAYGITVNTPAWDFGKLLGVYVTLFFLVAQLLNIMVFGIRPDLPTMIGGALIIAGGAIVAFGRF